MKVLITGATGSLGRHLVPAIRTARHGVRVVSRGPRTSSVPADVEWAQADLASGQGLGAALEGVEAVVHAASDPRNSGVADVGGTTQLVLAARAAGVGHVLYISIVGIDDIPLRYYLHKREAENVIASSAVPYSILRATQFHALLDRFLSGIAARVPFVLPLPASFKFQTVDESEVAERMAMCLAEGPRGRVPDFGGPEVLTYGAMARTWMDVKGMRRIVIPLPLPGAVAAGFRAGKNTVRDGPHGRIRWREWLFARKGP
jgi:uncharacterized protein YbjT (DUF2867 family)